MDDPTAALLESTSPYRASSARERVDVGWARALAVSVAIVIIGGALSAVHW